MKFMRYGIQTGRERDGVEQVKMSRAGGGDIRNPVGCPLFARLGCLSLRQSRSGRFALAGPFFFFPLLRPLL